MSKTLFEEAVADANKLRELAEETAKNRVVEAVMPQIRDMINRKILGEDLEDLDSDDSEMSLVDDLSDLSDDVTDLDKDYKEVQIDSSKGPSVSISVDGDVDIDLDVETEDDDDDDLVLDQAMAEALVRLMSGEKSKSKCEMKIEKLSENVSKLSSILESANKSYLTEQQIKRLKLSYMYCLREAMKLKSEIILVENTTQERLERRLTETIKEIRKMSKSNRRNIFDFLFEGEDVKKEVEELEEAELSLELSAEEQEALADADDVDAVGAALEDILGDIELDLGAEEGGEEEAEEAEEEEAEEGDEEAPVEAEEGAEEEEDLEEGDHMEGAHMEEGEDMDEVYEIDENMLRRELASMMNEEASDADPSLAHGGENVGDVLLDVSEDDLINALAEELGSVSESRRPVSRRSRRSASQELTEARKEIAQYKEAVADLKGQLVEMNLFNAKLLYANKLMQNKDLTMKQQKAIVEALDNAKTLREAKLLFKSLTESLNRRTGSKKLTEGSLRTIGSSSRSTRSAAPAPASNGTEADRWAVLAGLSKDK